MPNSKRRDKSKPNSNLVSARDSGERGGRNEPKGPRAATVSCQLARSAGIVPFGRSKRRNRADRHMNFASDNAAGVAPEILAAIAAANEGSALAYGNDALTRRVEQRFAELFEREVAVFLAPTGTAANALAIAHLTPPWGAVLCHAEAHIATDECGAPEFFGGGTKLIGLLGLACKIGADDFSVALDRGQWGGPHHVSPAVLSLSQATEAGTIYQPDEVRGLAAVAHARGLSVHMDGARLANALARLDVTPAQATWKAGVDVLSFGATKGGALAAEAILFFDPARAAGMQERRKRAGHLVSKHRFLAAQMEAYLIDDLWLRLARQANAMADQLGRGLAAAGHCPVWPVEANEVFVALPKATCERLQSAGASFYPWTTDSLPNRSALSDHTMLIRLVCSFATQAADVARFVATIKAG